MLTGQRTVAATYFEKGLDSQRVEPTLVYGTELIREYADGAIASKLYDIYPKTLKTKTIKTTFDFINSRIGVKIPPKKI